MSRRPVLGRGIASLIPALDSDSNDDGLESGAKNESPPIRLIPVKEITANRFQPRDSFDESSLEALAGSIRERGILQPLLVRQSSEGFELIAGERRLRAARRVGLGRVPAIVKSVSERDSLEIAIVENVQREDLNAIELALGFKQLQDVFGYTQEEIAKRVGKDRTSVTNHIRLLKLPKAVRSALMKGSISMGHARALLGLTDSGQIERLLGVVLERGLSVRQTEQAVKQIGKPAKSRKVSEHNAETVETEKRLRRLFQTQVRIRTKENGRGEIRIEYYSIEELNRILDLLPEA